LFAGHQYSVREGVTFDDTAADNAGSMPQEICFSRLFPSTESRLKICQQAKFFLLFLAFAERIHFLIEGVWAIVLWMEDNLDYQDLEFLLDHLQLKVR